MCIKIAGKKLHLYLLGIFLIMSVVRVDSSDCSSFSSNMYCKGTDSLDKHFIGKQDLPVLEGPSLEPIIFPPPEPPCRWIIGSHFANPLLLLAKFLFLRPAGTGPSPPLV
jgi:hypothetical protein